MPAIETWHWRRLAVPLAVAGVFGLTACGQPDTPASASSIQTGSASTATPGAPAGFEAFRSCLAENGVTLP